MSPMTIAAASAVCIAVTALLWKLASLKRKLRTREIQIRKLQAERKRHMNEIVELGDHLHAYENLLIQTPGGITSRINDCRETTRSLLMTSPQTFLNDQTLLQRLEAIDCLLTDLNMQFNRRQLDGTGRKGLAQVSPLIYLQVRQEVIQPHDSAQIPTAAAA